MMSLWYARQHHAYKNAQNASWMQILLDLVLVVCSSQLFGVHGGVFFQWEVHVS